MALKNRNFWLENMRTKDVNTYTPLTYQHLFHTNENALISVPDWESYEFRLLYCSVSHSCCEIGIYKRNSEYKEADFETDMVIVFINVHNVSCPIRWQVQHVRLIHLDEPKKQLPGVVSVDTSRLLISFESPKQEASIIIHPARTWMYNIPKHWQPQFGKYE